MPAVDVGSDWVPLRLRLDGVKSRGVCGRLAGNSLERLKIDGGQGRNRTADASLFRAALYHLSYLATRRCAGTPALLQR